LLIVHYPLSIFPMFLSSVQAAEKRLRDLFPPTPLEFSKRLSDKYHAKIYLKREDLSPVRSYKIRGAFTLISLLTDAERKRGVVCASAGNHAQGVAFSCAYYKIPGKIFMPVTTPFQKIEKTKFLGKEFVEVILIGDIFDEAYTASAEYCKKEKMTFVPPFDDEKIMVGAGTVGLEITKQLPQKIDYFLVPVGGGGLAAGMSEFFHGQDPSAKIICVEPSGATTLKTSLDAGKVTPLDTVNTFVDGAAVKKIGTKTFAILKKRITEKVLAIPENRICATMLDLLFYEGIVVEPAGALSVDALKDLSLKDIKGKTLVCIVSGGNFDFDRLPDVKERAMKYSGLKKYFILRLPQRPGALKGFLDLLGADDDISRFEYLKKSSKTFGSVLLGIETKDPKNFPHLFARMKKAGFGYQDVTEDEILADFVI
jgi:threonine dehydratase